MTVLRLLESPAETYDLHDQHVDVVLVYRRRALIADAFRVVVKRLGTDRYDYARMHGRCGWEGGRYVVRFVILTPDADVICTDAEVDAAMRATVGERLLCCLLAAPAAEPALADELATAVRLHGQWTTLSAGDRRVLYRVSERLLLRFTSSLPTLDDPNSTPRRWDYPC